MTDYRKPEVTVLGNATAVIQGNKIPSGEPNNTPVPQDVEHCD